MNKLVIFIGFAMIAMLPLTALHAAEQKIAFIDLEKTFNRFSKTKHADAKLKERANKFNTDRENIVNKIKELRKSFESLRADAMDDVLAEEAKLEKKNKAEEVFMEIRQEENRLRRFDELKAKQLEEQGRRMRKDIVEEIQIIIKEYACEKGYAAVFDSSGQTLNGVPVLLFVNSHYDITDDIINLLNQ